MKKLLSLVAALCILASTTMAYEKEISSKELAKNATTFVSKAFPKATYERITLDDDGEYEVYLNNGAKLDFNRGGEWESVEMYAAEGLSANLLPHKDIATYLKQNYPNSAIRKISRDKNFTSWEYEVKIENGLELIFNQNGKFIKIDD